MRFKLSGLILFIAALFGSGTSTAQNVAFTATRVPDITGSTLTAGVICFPNVGNCNAVTAGAVSGSAVVPKGTGAILVKDSSGNIIWQTASNAVTITGAFSFDSYVIPSNATVTIVGVPRGACQVGAIETRTDLTPNVNYTCTFVGGQNVWKGSASGSAVGSPPGLYSGVGAPSFPCTAPCVYVRSDAGAGGAFYALSANSGIVSANWILQATGPTGAAGPTGAPGVSSLQQLAGLFTRLPANTGNLFNPAAATVGAYIDTNGNLQANVSSLTESDYIPANTGGVMTTVKALPALGGNNTVSFYDQGFTYLSGSNAAVAAGGAITVPTTSAFIRLTINTGDLNTEMVVSGTSPPSTYQGYGTVSATTVSSMITSSTGALEAAANRYTTASLLAFLPPNPNLFNPAAAAVGLQYAGSTTLDASQTAYGTVTMAVNGGQTYVLANGTNDSNGAYGMAWLDATGAYISGVSIPFANGQNFTAPATAAFVKVPSLTSNYSTQSFTVGTTVPTYSAFPALYPGYVVDAHIAATVSSTEAASARFTNASIAPFLPPLSNLFNPATVTPNVILYTGLSGSTGTGACGTTTPLNGFSVSALIPVQPGASYTLTLRDPDTSTTWGFVWKDINGNCTGLGIGFPFAAGQVFTAPSNAFYAQFSVSDDSTAAQAFTLGTVPAPAGTAFVALQATAPTRAAVASTLNANVGVLGDSISSILNPPWQSVVVARTGAKIALQDARPGRAFSTAFECYGTTTPGATLGTYSSTAANGVCGSNYGGVGSTNGNTLAQNLAPISTMLVFLGTNDQGLTLGSLGDATNAGTFYGNMRWVIETLQTANPGMRILMITPQLNGFASAAVTQGVVNAILAYGNSMGLPVLNLYANGGNNTITSSTVTGDGTHDSTYGVLHNLGPEIANFLQAHF
jgi:hypothetical protein